MDLTDCFPSLHARQNPLFTTEWLAGEKPDQRHRIVTAIYTAFIHHSLSGQHVLELDGGKAAMIVIPVVRDEHNVVAPGYGVFGQIKASSTCASIRDPPPSVLALNHIKARRLEGRSYLYIWALGVNPWCGLDGSHRDAYWVAMVDYVMGIADARDLPVVTEVCVWGGGGGK